MLTMITKMIKKMITKMIKFKDQSEKKVNRLVWILDCSNYCLKNMKTKTNKDQPTNNQKVKTNRK